VTTAADGVASFVPDLLVERLRRRSEPWGTPWADRVTGALLLADISGFTVIAEHLGQQGPAGAEALGGLLNAAWGRLLALIRDAGGDVLKFAGDALLACWPAAGGEAGGLAVAARAAAGCAQAMEATLERYAAAEEVRLRLRVGVGTGEVVLLDVGGVLDRRELLVTGDAVARTAGAVRQAAPGQVVVAPEAWALLDGSCTGVPLPAGGVQLTSAPPVPPAAPRRRLPLPEGLDAALLPYLPRALLGLLQAGQEAWLAELRRVTVVFVNLPDLAHGATPDHAHRVMRALQAALYRYEGSIDKLGVDDKGTMLVAALGLPPLAHEDDPARGVRAAMAMRAAAVALGERAAAGVATGRVFCGVVGDRWRREYTMLGAVVNLAARLMQAAPDGILCDATTAREAGRALAFEAMPAMAIKGWAEPVAAFRPRGEPAGRSGLESGGPAKAGTLVGRTAERERLTQELRILASSARGHEPGRAVVVVIEGEAGVGKSRLVADVIRRARAYGLLVLTGAGDAIEHRTPYYAWREVVAGLATIDAGAVQARRRAVLGLLGPDPETRELAPLLNVVLPLELPDTPSVAALGAQGRADQTRALLVRLLRAAIAGEPAVLVLEDAHWLDSASWALALEVSRQVAPLLLLLVTRPQPERHLEERGSGWDAAGSLLRASGGQRLRLGPLPSDEIDAVVRQSLGVDGVPAQVVSLIQQKAEGNPLFSEQMAYALRDAGLVEVLDGRCRLAPGVDDVGGLTFPDTVQGVITSRIDRLTPAQQLTLKVASVIGREFALRVLRHVHPLEGSASQLADDLTVLERASLTVLDTTEPDPAYLFKHVIVQEAAYNLMLVSQRRQLHRAVAEWYERTRHGDLEPLAPLLAHHWRAAEVPAKAIDHLEQAGNQALRTGAYQEAVRFFTEALELDDRSRGTQASGPGGDARVARRHAPAPGTGIIRRARWEHQLADAYHGLGQLGPEQEHLHAALALLNRRLPAHGRRLASGLLWQVAEQIRNRLSPRSPAAPTPEARAALLEAAEVYERLYALAFFANRRGNLLHAAVKGLNLAEASGSSEAVARLSACCALGIGAVPLHRMAEGYARRSLAAAELVADPLTRATVLQLIGLRALGLGRWPQARAHLEEGAAILRQVGDRRRLAEVSGLLGWLAYIQGAFADAAAPIAELDRLGRQTGDPQLQSWARFTQAVIAVRAGDLDRAELLLQDRRAPALAALLSLRRGDWQGARELVPDALRWVRVTPIKCYWFDLYAVTAEVAVSLWHASRQSGSGGDSASRTAARHAVRSLRRYARAFPIGLPRALLCQGLVAWIAGRPVRARRAWRRSAVVAQRLGMPYDELLAHAQLGRHGDASERNRHLARAHELHAKLDLGQSAPDLDALVAHLP
jgi:class 3 adenylate cyclase/tetratricopeptide (TPR) repeat protein